MTTIKSYSDKSRFLAIFRTSLRQQTPIAIVSGILSFLIVPLIYLVDQIHREGPPYVPQFTANNPTAQWQYYFRAGVYLDVGQSMAVLVLLMVMALVVALVQSSYMHSKKMTDLYHSMPIRRPQLLTATSLASVTTIFAPFLAVYLLTVAAQLLMYGRHLLGYAWYFQYIALDLAGALIAVLAVYAFTVFIATFVGTVFDNFALTGVLGVTPLLLTAIGLALWMSQTYGASADWFDEILAWLSPFSAPFLRFAYMNALSRGDSSAASGIPGTLVLYGVWLVITAMLYLAAIWNYNRRKSELAEQTQPQGVLQMIAKCFAAFCGSALFYAVFSDVNNAFTVVLTSLFGALLIGLLAELILSRGIRSIKRNLVWLAGSGLLFVVLIFCLRVDLIGYTDRVPAAEQVESVTVSYRGRFERLSDNNRIYDLSAGGYYYGDGQYDTILADPESIAIVTEAHRGIVENKPDREGGFSGFYDFDGEEYSGEWLRIEYKLKDGGTMIRGYNPIYSEAYRMLSRLETQEEFIRQNHAIFLLDALMGEGTAAQSLDAITVLNVLGDKGESYRPTVAEATLLLTAAQQDMLAEPLEDLTNPPTPALGYLELPFELDFGDNHTEMTVSTVILDESYTHTLAVLRELGVWDGAAMIPEADEVRFRPDYTQTDRVLSLLPGWVSEYDYGEEPIPTVTDPAEIEAILAASRIQMLVPNGEMMWTAGFYKDGEYLGSQMIRHADLPESVRQKAMDWAELQKDSGYGYPVFPELAPMAAAVAVSENAENVELALA